jgi:arabinofuranosyltransferase
MMIRSVVLPSSTLRFLRYPKNSRTWLFIAICVFFLLHAAQYWSWVEDDVFITLRYADNLADGKGLVYNEGQRVEGFSNLAWVLLAAGAQLAGADPLFVLRLSGLIGGLACLLIAWLMARRLSPEGGVELLLAPLFLAFGPILARHSVSGLETTAYAMCFSFCLLTIISGAETRRRFVLGLSSLCMLIVLRPEGAVFGLLLLIIARGGSLGRRPAWIVFGLALAVFLAWRWWYFGTLLPNTFYFKMTGGESAIRSGIRYTREFLHYNGGGILVGFSLVLLLSRHAASNIRRILPIIALQTALVVKAGGDWMYHYRFYAPLMPLLSATLAGGIGFTLAAGRRLPGRCRSLSLIIAAALAVTFSGIYLGERHVWRVVMPSVESGNYLTQSYARLGLWLREHTPPGSTVAVSDIGAIGYYSRREIIDMFGLVDRHIARMPGELHTKNDPDHVLARKPDYVILVERTNQDCEPWYWRLPDRAIAEKPEFAADYRLVHSMEMGFEQETARVYERATRP